jgi:hypothetical protein
MGLPGGDLLRSIPSPTLIDQMLVMLGTNRYRACVVGSTYVWSMLADAETVHWLRDDLYLDWPKSELG